MLQYSFLRFLAVVELPATESVNPPAKLSAPESHLRRRAVTVESRIRPAKESATAAGLSRAVESSRTLPATSNRWRCRCSVWFHRKNCRRPGHRKSFRRRRSAMHQPECRTAMYKQSHCLACRHRSPSRRPGCASANRCGAESAGCRWLAAVVAGQAQQAGCTRAE